MGKKAKDQEIHEMTEMIAHLKDELKNKLEQVRKEIEMESRTHTDVTNFLHKKRKYLGEKVEYWMEKFEVDTEAKTAELAQLKADKEKDLRALQELARTYDDYERVVIEDRMIKQKKKEEEKRKILEDKSSVKVQVNIRFTSQFIS